MVKENVPVAKRYYLAANSDGTGILSTRPLRRFIDLDNDVCSYQDTRLVPHWCGAFKKGEIEGNYHIPVGEYLFLPKKIVSLLAGKELTWEDEPIIIECDD